MMNSDFQQAYCKEGWTYILKRDLEHHPNWPVSY